MPEPTRIGALRWMVQLFERDQAPDIYSSGIVEQPVDIKLVHASIEPLRPSTFYGALLAAGDAAPTHLITLRFQDYLPETNAITRTTRKPDGTQRTEFFRVRRVLEIDGRKRFVQVEAQLERSVPA